MNAIEANSLSETASIKTVRNLMSDTLNILFIPQHVPIPNSRKKAGTLQNQSKNPSLPKNRANAAVSRQTREIQNKTAFFRLNILLFDANGYVVSVHIH